MPGLDDIYVLSDFRDPKTISTFLPERVEWAIDYAVPQYSDKPTEIIKDEKMKR